MGRRNLFAGQAQRRREWTHAHSAGGRGRADREGARTHAHEHSCAALGAQPGAATADTGDGAWEGAPEAGDCDDVRLTPVVQQKPTQRCKATILPLKIKNRTADSVDYPSYCDDHLYLVEITRGGQKWNPFTHIFLLKSTQNFFWVFYECS